MNDNVGQSSVAFVRAFAIDEDVLSQLSQLPYSPTGTRRVCLHQSESAPLHVMLVESREGTNFPAHMHNDSDEVSFAISGELEILVWLDGETEKPNRIVLSAREGNVSVSMIPRGTVHITRPLKGNCVYLEVKQGPFDKDALVKVAPEKLHLYIP